MLRKYYSLLIGFVDAHTNSPWQQHLAAAAIRGTFFVFVLMVPVLALPWAFWDSPYGGTSLPYVATAAVLVGSLHLLNKKRQLRFAGVYLMMLYVLLVFGLTYQTGVGPVSIALSACVVTLAGILYGTCCTLIATAIITAFFVCFRIIELKDMVQPTYLVAAKPTTFDPILCVTLLLFALAGMSSLAHQHMMRLQRELKATENDFLHKKSELSAKIEQQNQQLEAARLEKMQQFYRFAEIGEISTALLHDLANDLSVLSLEVGSIKARGTVPAVRRAKQSIRHIDELLDHTRQQFKGQTHVEIFDVAKEITHTVKLLGPNAKKAQVTLDWSEPTTGAPIKCRGDKVTLQRLVANLIKNALDSYDDLPVSGQAKRAVRITFATSGKTIVLTITDWGRGIRSSDRHRIFEPFYTTKKGGMGVGLYLSKRFIEENFGGTIELHNPEMGSMFTVRLPRA